MNTGKEKIPSGLTNQDPKEKRVRLGSLLWKAGFLIFITILIFFRDTSPKPQEEPRVCFHETCFAVEIADTFYKRSTGLAFRTFLGPNKGMLFPFENESDHLFWMKNMNFPIDIIFLDKDLQVKHIAYNMQPCITDECPTIRAGVPISYVLELNAGTAQKMDLNKGDELDFYLTPQSEDEN